MLIGREGELAALARVVDAARQGSAGCVLVRGEPGAGKSALLDHVATTTSRATVLRTRGVEVEAPWAFAALHQLLRPVLSWRDALPAPQARALRVAFGEEDGAAVEPFLMGVATLGLLTAAAEERLVVCLVDDAHWLDVASTEALMFCARRIAADRVAMVFSVRDGVANRLDSQGLPELAVEGLPAEDARTLLGRSLGDHLNETVTDRLITEAGGNPLALLELPRALSADQLDGTAPLPPQLPLSQRVEGVFLEAVRRLSPDVQSVLLLAAADDTGDLAVLKAASSSLGLPPKAFDAALVSDLAVSEGSTMSLRHPLVRSALYQAAADDQRRSAHTALAAGLAAFGQDDRAAWQRAAAAVDPDPEVVAALEVAGQRASRRGAHTSACAAYERASQLCPDHDQRAALALAAARSAWAGGDAAHAQSLLADAAEGAAEPAVAADVARLRGHIEVNLGSPTLAHQIFVQAASDASSADPARALEIAALAAIMATYGADSGTRPPLTAILAATGPVASSRTTCLEQMLVSMTCVADKDWRGAVDALDAAVAAGAEVEDREVLWNLGNCSLQLGADETQLRFYSLALSRAREAGAVTAVVYSLQRLCFSYFLAGDMLGVRTGAEESLSLGSTLRQPAMTAPPLAWLTLLAAVQGHHEYDDLLHQAEEAATAAPLGILADPVHDLLRWAKGTHAAASGDLTGATHHLARFRLPALARMAAVQRIDAAVRADEPQAALDTVGGLSDFAASTRRPWALAADAYGRAVTAAAPDDAERWFLEALAHQSSADRPLDQARIQLAYGEWLRRGQRRVDARTQLRHALDTFQDTRAEPLVQRTAAELRASGESARRRDPSTAVKLTPTELKIALLVSSGMSNKDVAAQIWVSPRTVAFHLRNIFAKAQISSRGELAQLDLS